MRLRWIPGGKAPRMRTVVLMYHRVAAVSSDPWQLAVSAAHFEEQLRVLERNYRVISARELVDRLARRELLPNSVCLTFDDGYGDNYRTALPLLEKYHCPATFFMVTGWVGRRARFWWDVLADVLLNADTLPETIRIGADSFDLAGEALHSSELQRKHRQWHHPADPPTRRAAVYLAIYEKLKCRTPEEQAHAVAYLLSLANLEYQEEDSLPVTKAQLIQMSHHPLAEIGLHTHSHPALGSQSPERQSEEIGTCANYLKGITGRVVPMISFPHGNYNQDTLRLVKEHQLRAAFTTEEQAVSQRTDPYRLGRFQVGDWNGETFGRKLMDWMGGSL